MQKDLIKRELIQLDLQVLDQSDFFDQSVSKLIRLGYVKPTFREALGKREQSFPTGLPTEPEAVAIPHADPEHIIKPFIMATRLKAPVDWHEMGQDDVVHPIRFIFLLGFTRSDGHVELLQILLNSFQDQQFMKKISEVNNADEFFGFVCEMPGLKD